ncbi:MAG: zinc ribbon domain-containing protein [Lachnospiraceae bacterium]|nr:zinc ribbon domain-containing protein [Lachnospiraceae bacterium]
MYCGNCGAEISADDAYCPYCGVMNARAAEKEYMDKLEDIREDTEKLGAESGKQTRTGIRKSGRLAVRIILIIAAVVVGFYALYRFLDYQFVRGNADEVKEEAAFKAEYFPQLDALYAEGDEAAVMAYLNEIGGEKGAYVLNTWVHYQYMTYYMDYVSVCRVKKGIMDDALWEQIYSEILYDGIELIYQTKKNLPEMTREEKEKAKGYREEAEEIFADYLSLDKSKLDEIYEGSIDDGGYLYWSKIDEWAERTIKERH